MASITSLFIPGSHWKKTGLSQWNPQHIERLKKAATITLLGLAGLASLCLAIRHPKIHFMSTLGIGAVSLILLPAFFCHANAKKFKTALSINFFVLGSLLLGGGLAKTFLSTRMLFTSVKSAHVRASLSSILSLIRKVGVDLPVFILILKKGYQLFKDEKFTGRIAELQKIYKGIPKQKFKLLRAIKETVVFNSSFLYFQIIMLLDFAIKKSKYLSKFKIFNNVNQLSSRIELVSGWMSTQEKISLDQFKLLMDLMNHWAISAFSNGIALPDHVRKKLILIIKCSLNSLSATDLVNAVDTISKYGPYLIPNFFTKDQLITLVSQEILLRNETLMKKYLNLMHNWKDIKDFHQSLYDKVVQLEKDIQGIKIPKPTPAEYSQFDQRLQALNKTFIHLLTVIDVIHRGKKTFSFHMSQQISDSSVENYPDMKKCFDNQDLWKEVSEIYRSLTMVGKGSEKTLHDHFQLVKSKMKQFQENEDEDEFSSVLFLAIQCAFVVKDYDDLQIWLKLDSKDEIDEALKKIGLEKQEDYHAKGIFIKNEKSSKELKEKVKINLKNYIDKNSIPKEPEKKVQSVQKSKWKNLVHKVSGIFYYTMLFLLSVTPILLSPLAGFIGFTLGSSFLLLKRMKFSKITNIEQKIHSMIVKIPLSDVFRQYFQDRQIFRLTPSRIKRVQWFVDSSFKNKMKKIHLNLFFEMIFHKIFTSPLHGFLQGINLAKDVLKQA